MTVRIAISFEPLRDFCRRWRVRELSVFGSALRSDFRPESDVDVMVEFEGDADWRYYDLMDMREELEKLIGRRIDLVERRVVEAGGNPIRRDHILTHRETLYVA